MRRWLLDMTARPVVIREVIEPEAQPLAAPAGQVRALDQPAVGSEPECDDA